MQAVLRANDPEVQEAKVVEEGYSDRECCAAPARPQGRDSGDAELAAEQAEQTMLTAHTFSSLRRRWLRNRYSSNSQQAAQHALRSFNANRTPALLSS